MRCRRIDDGKFEVDVDKDNSKDKSKIRGSFPFDKLRVRMTAIISTAV
jgi:hypothetical protein